MTETTVVQREKLYTAEEFFKMMHESDTSKLWELSEGRIVKRI